MAFSTASVCIENHARPDPAKAKGHRYDGYGALERMDFNAIPQSTMIEDEAEKLEYSGTAAPGSIMLSG